MNNHSAHQQADSSARRLYTKLPFSSFGHMMLVISRVMTLVVMVHGIILSF